MDNTLSLDYQQTDFGREFADEVERLDGRIDDEAEARETADREIWTEIEAIEAASDVVDIVGTKAELDNYDTSALKDNDIIKVLQDETHDDAIAYYRWNTSTEAFIFVGVEGPYYTASETDQLLAGKQDTLTAGVGIDISNGVISSTATAGAIVYGDQVEHNGFVYLQFYLDSAKTDLITIDEMIDLLEAGSVVINTPLADSTTKNFYVVAYQAKETASGTVLYFYTTEGAAISRYYTWSDADQFDGAKQNLYWLQNKLFAGSNISIQGDTISATDTTYSDFVGTDGTAAGTAGLVPAPTTTDAGKFLKADGTWDTAGGEENATTVFYVSQIVGSSRFEFWRDSAKTDQVTQSEFITAVQDGPVVLEYDWAMGDQNGEHRWIISQSSISEYSGGVSINFTTHGTQTEVAYYTWEYGNTYATRRVNNLEFQLTAGANISISRTTQGTTISATDTTYTAGTGITIDANNVISASVTQNNINSTDWSALWQ